MGITTAIANPQEILSLEDWMQNPLDDTEWIDGELVEKNGMTLKHSKIQGNLLFHWKSYKNSSQLGGEVYTEVPCRTNQQGRRPDVAYLTPDLVARYGNESVLPQSFPLSAEIISPTDYAEDAIAKATEYLNSSGEEVWLVFPENCWIIVITRNHRQIFISGETVRTQKVLLGFSLAVDELFA